MFLAVYEQNWLCQIFGPWSTKVKALDKKIDLDRFYGEWFEIARKPMIYEKNMQCISVTYLDDGKYMSFDA